MLTVRHIPRWVMTIWASIVVAALLALSASRLRAGAPVSFGALLAALAADLVFAAIVAAAFWQQARQWANKHLAARQVLARATALTGIALILAYACVAAYLLVRNRDPLQVLNRLIASPLHAAADWSLLCAIAISVVPIPFLLRRIEQAPTVDRTSIRSTGAIEYLRVADVLAVVGAENYVELVLTDRSVLHRATLSEMERLLGTEFVRVHRSALARRLAIVGLERSGSRQHLVLSNDRRIRVSQSYRGALIRHAER
jgi:DNA-binding LytR/AlgR family response regulator